ncbi:MAG: Kiwa anti-phage protein KwaB-like domain-containing protein, partial [Candidatus Sulfotelmatobacter sp.]
DEGEIFTIQPFQLPEDYANAPKHPNEYESISFDANNPPSIKAILAGVHSHSTNTTKLYFQSYSTTQLLLNNFTLLTALHSKGTFHKLNYAGLTLGSRLTAVFQDDTLLFRSYTLVNRFLDIKDYFREATDEEVSLVLSHKLFDVEDQDDVVNMSDSWMRKRFSALQASGILDKITPRKTANKAAKYGLTIEVNRKDGKDAIAFPTDKRKAKQLLAFLNEGYFQGELTDQLYQTNSHRSLGAIPQPSE